MYSSIKRKFGVCPICKSSGDSRQKPLTAGKCNAHYWYGRSKINEDKNNSKPERFINEAEKELSELVKELDIWFSRLIRIRASDDEGNCKCFICGYVDDWKSMENGHYIKRGNMYLRYDDRNCKVNCHTCNVIKGGNYEMYTIALENDKKGIVEILESEANIVYKYSRHELIEKLSEVKKSFFEIADKKNIKVYFS